MRIRAVAFGNESNKSSVKVLKNFSSIEDLFNFSLERITHYQPEAMEKPRMKSIGSWGFIRLKGSQSIKNFPISDKKVELDYILNF